MTATVRPAGQILKFSWPPDLWGLLLGQGHLESRTQSFWGWQVAVPGGATAPTGTSPPGGSVETIVPPPLTFYSQEETEAQRGKEMGPRAPM